MVARSEIYEEGGMIAGVSDPSYFRTTETKNGRTGINAAANAWRNIIHQKPAANEGAEWGMRFANAADDWRRTAGLEATQQAQAAELHIDSNN